MLYSGLDTRFRGYDKRSFVLYAHQNRLCQQPAPLRGWCLTHCVENIPLPSRSSASHSL